MKINCLEIIDWEPAVLRFFFSGFSKELANRFKVFVRAWLESGQRDAGCKCYFRFADFSGDSRSGSIEVATEWLCGKCAQKLVNLAKANFPSLKRVEFGDRDHERDPGPKFISVAGREVEFETGEKAQVMSFTISRRPVSIGEFEQFVSETGYVTTAEIKGETWTFRDNDALSGIGPRARRAIPASCVSFKDAQAYCEHAGYRLPTEAEWLAAAVRDTTERKIDSSEELRLRLKPVSPKDIVSIDWDITATQTPDGLIVTRSGPLHFVKSTWRNPAEYAYHRKLIAPDDYDLMVTFRVVQGCGASG